ncbi:MAG: RnfABCDGE type electron transport complex subunit D, partial [Oscillospiraceae bacterium]|nr:RnfABCDGE type electron transport complex subunit D [Oscillospiraceae bacterium]
MPDETPRWRQRFADNHQARAWNVTSLLMTLPLLFIGAYYYGAQALRLAAVAVLTAVLTELVVGHLVLRRRTLDDWNAVVTGLWIACMLPAETQPANSVLLYAAAGAMFAVLVAKLPFGGTMSAPFSPAAAGFAFLTVCFPHRIFSYVPSVLAPPSYNTSLALILRQGHSVVEGRQSIPILLGQSVG